VTRVYACDASSGWPHARARVTPIRQTRHTCALGTGTTSELQGDEVRHHQAAGRERAYPGVGVGAGQRTDSATAAPMTTVGRQQRRGAGWG